MSHALIDQRSLDFHRLIAEKIRQQPDLMDLVRSNLEHTLVESDLAESLKHPLREWLVILQTRSFEEILHVLTENSHEGQRLRSSTPFWGIITQQERREIFRRYESTGL